MPVNFYLFFINSHKSCIMEKATKDPTLVAIVFVY
jgi:hypothetical protein